MPKRARPYRLNFGSPGFFLFQEASMSTISLPQQAELPARSPQPRPALRLVSTKQLERDQWLAIRKQGIGSSDAAAAVGLNPYCSPLELWMIKTGRDGNLPQVDPDDDSSPLYWGTLLESVVAIWLSSTIDLHGTRLSESGYTMVTQPM
jgi:hypothetical protein